MIYYGMRILQRLGLLFVGLHTLIYWVAFLVTVYLEEYSRQTVGHQFRDPVATDKTLVDVVNLLSWRVLYSAIFSALITVAMLAIPRVRRYEKRLVVDGLVIVVFCVLSVMASQFVVQLFVQHYFIYR
jgi:hypothetical protein